MKQKLLNISIVTFLLLAATAATLSPRRDYFLSSVTVLDTAGGLCETNGSLTVTNWGTNKVFFSATAYQGAPALVETNGDANAVFINGLGGFAADLKGANGFIRSNGVPGLMVNGALAYGVSSNVTLTNATGTRTLLITNGLIMGVN